MIREADIQPGMEVCFYSGDKLLKGTIVSSAKISIYYSVISNGKHYLMLPEELMFEEDLPLTADQIQA